VRCEATTEARNVATAKRERPQHVRESPLLHTPHAISPRIMCPEAILYY